MDNNKREKVLKFIQSIEKAIKEVSLETGVKEDIVLFIFCSILEKSKGAIL